MSYYVENNLTKNEKVVNKAKINFLAILPWIILIVILISCFITFRNFCNDFIYDLPDGEIASEVIFYFGLIFFIIFMIIPIIYILEILSIEVAITNKRIIGKKGLFSTTALDIPISQISNAGISLSFFGKIFKYATIEVSSTGMKIKNGNTESLKLKAISNSREFLNSINEAIEENAEQQRKLQAEELAKAMQNKNQ